MARMYPNRLSNRRPTEKKVYKRLRDELDESWRVYHSVDILDHPRHAVGEADFVLVGPPGVYVIEVKGCQIQRATAAEGHKWIYHYRNPPTVDEEGPHDQALKNRMALQKWFLDQNFGINTFFGCALINPNHRVEFPITNISWSDELVLSGRESFNTPGSVKTLVDKMVKYWQDRTSREENINPSLLSNSFIKNKLHKSLFVECSLPSLGDSISGLNHEQNLALNYCQSRLMNHIERSKYSFLVEGPAGSGKTLIAKSIGLHFAAKGERVLFVCKSRLLARLIKQDLAEDSNLEILSMTELLSLVYRTAIKNELSLTETLDFIQQKEELNFATTIEREYDILVLDEGQDLLSDDLLLFFSARLKHGLEGSRWFLFFDPNQTMHDQNVQSGLDTLQSFQTAVPYLLDSNCRNTSKIIALTQELTGINTYSGFAVDGGDCITHWFTEGKEISTLQALLSDYYNQGVALGDIAILYPSQIGNPLCDHKCVSVSNDNGSHIRIYKDRRPNNIVGACVDLEFFEIAKNPECYEPSKHILVASIEDFKGLERNVVIVTGLGRCPTELYLERNAYVGTTRARTNLDVLFPNNFKKEFFRLSRANSR